MGTVYCTYKQQGLNHSIENVPLFDNLEAFKSWVEDEEAKHIFTNSLDNENQAKIQRYFEKYGKLPTNK